MIAYVSVYRIGKIKNNGAARKRKCFTRRRENGYVFAVEIVLYKIVELLYRLVLVPKVVEPVELYAVIPSALVFPVRSDTELCRFVHIVGPDLNLEYSSIVEHGSVYGPVSVVFGYRYIILEPG